MIINKIYGILIAILLTQAPTPQYYSYDYKYLHFNSNASNVRNQNAKFVNIIIHFIYYLT